MPSQVYVNIDMQGGAFIRGNNNALQNKKATKYVDFIYYTIDMAYFVEAFDFSYSINLLN